MDPVASFSMRRQCEAMCFGDFFFGEIFFKYRAADIPVRVQESVACKHKAAPNLHY